jgi:Glucodextranase, domain B/Peptidase M15
LYHGTYRARVLLEWTARAALAPVRVPGHRFHTGAVGLLAAAVLIGPGSLHGAGFAVPSSLLDFGVYATGTGCGAITISGNAYVDSFDSSQGSYSQTKQLSQGIVGVSGNIRLDGNAKVNGPIFALNTAVGNCQNGTPGITLSGKGMATGGYIQLSAAPVFAVVPAVPPGTTDVHLTSNAILPPGSYGNITVSGAKTLIFPPGTYNINSITLTGHAVLTVNPPGQVIVNVAGNGVTRPIDFTGGTLDNPSAIPRQFQLFYGGNLTIALAGGSGAYALLYAPNAAVSLSGGADWYGAMAVATLDDAGGSAIHYDRSLAVPPTITALVSPAPNTTGWNNSNATVSFSCSDPIVGIASCSSPSQLTAEGANQVVKGTAVNRAGFSTNTSVTVKIDKTPPTISAAVSPTPNANGWNNSNVTVTFNCSDSLSGIDICPAPVLVTAETAGQLVMGTARDKAGNTATASATVKLDKTPPVITITAPTNGAKVAVASQTISGTLTEALSGIATVTCNGAPATHSGTSFSCGVTLMLGSNSISVRATDVAGNSSTSTLTLTYAPAPTVTITSPANLSYLNISPTTVNGTVDDSTATVMVNSIQAAVANGRFSMSLPLAEGPNIVTATATNATGAAGTASIQVTLDTTPPHVTITSPPDQFVTSDTSLSVAGNVNDIVVGTVNDQQAQVTVNSISAQVANRSFLAVNVPLNLGSNLIQAVARDRVGNAATAQITVTRQAPSPSQIRLISGNNQTGTIGSVLPAPLVVAMTDSSGNLAANKPVIFKVTQNNGMVGTGETPAASVIATTNAQGQAQVQWTLGMRAGAGGNTVEAYSVGFGGTAIFTGTGTQGPAGKIVIDTGNNQIGVIGQPLPKPLIAVVVDAGNNRLPNVPVSFTMKQGGSSFSGQPSITLNSDSDGRVAATLTLGLQEGNSNNLIEANFPSNQGFPASFTASGRAAGNAANTTITGVVLDNSNAPIPGVTIRAVLTNLLTSNSSIINSVAAVQTNAQGQFSITPAPVGFVKLLVDGSTAQRPGKYPTLDYDMVTIAGQNNTLGMPIYLLPLSATNQLCVTATTGGGTLTIPEAPGFSLTFGPGQVTFPGGTKEGCVGVTVVHPDKVPMSPGFGQQPRFIVTIQPSGALFNPPAPITLPNVDGLNPRAITEMYSFDHDIGSFVAIGTGTVSDDGQIIRSNQGVGVLKAGWHCGGDPNARGTVADCPVCMFCQGATASSVSCIPNPGAIGTSCGPAGNPCLTGVCGGILGGTSIPNQPTGTCVITPVLGVCTVGGSSGSCNGGVCQGPPGQCSCPQGGTCVNGQCVNPPCTPGTACTAGNNTPGTCNQSSQCIGNGGQCSPPTPVNLNGVCTVTNCSMGGSNGFACNAGGNPPGICINQQCQGSGNQCSPSCGGGTCTNGTCGSSCPTVPFTVSIIDPPDNPMPSDSLWQFNYSFLSTSTITAQGDVSQTQNLSSLTWNVTPNSGGIQNQMPANMMGAVFSFMANIGLLFTNSVTGLPSDFYQPGNHDCSTEGPLGICGRSAPLSYVLLASFCGSNTSNTITQDQRDIIRQEYVNHGLIPPDRTAIHPASGTTHWPVAMARTNAINNTAYDFIVGDPGQLAESIRSEYNRLLKSDKQVVLPGTSGLAAARIVVRADATISVSQLGSLLHTPPNFGCVGGPNECDDLIDPNDPNAIIAGPNGRADTRVLQGDFDLLINSAWRNPERNEAVGGASTSRHQAGNALDFFPVLNVADLDRLELMCTLLTAGTNVVGASNAFAEESPNNLNKCDATNHLITHVHVQQ